MHRDVEISVVSCNNRGNMIGWLFVENVNLSVELVKEGLYTLHKSAEHSKYFKLLQQAEKYAKDKKINLWKNYIEEPVEANNNSHKPVHEGMVKEQKTNYVEVLVSENTAKKNNSIDDAESFFKKNSKTLIKAVVESVLDGNTMKLLLLPERNMILLYLSGVRCPPKGVELGDEAKFFVEVRLLQKDVEVTLEGVLSNRKTQSFYGTIHHPAGDIAFELVKQGFAICPKFGMNYLHESAEKLWATERQAKENKLRCWKYHTNTGQEIAEREIVGTVIEIIREEGLLVKSSRSKKLQKIYFSNIIPARLGVEVLRGNLGEELVKEGLATVMNNPREEETSQCLYKLKKAEEIAKQSHKGLYSKSSPLKPHITDCTSAAESARAKALLPSLQRFPMLEAVVEYVVSGCKMRLHVRKENSFINFLLAGVTRPFDEGAIQGG